jgi:phage/plasmid-like protein (TIGR03299 family)
MSLLDTIISGMGGDRVDVVSEQHDANRINWVADPGEMIACGYLPQIRRKAGEADAAYQLRITPIVMALPQRDQDRIMGAAKKRAGLDTSNGRVNLMVAGQPAWHGLGVRVAEAANSLQTVELSGLGWTVRKTALSYPAGEGMKEADGVFGIVRNDTNAYLGTVGSRYQPIQNADGFAMLDSVLGEFGAKYEAAGSLYGGKRVFMLVRLPEQAFSVGSRDKVEAFALFTNPHDGSAVAECFATSNRVVCANTLRIARSGQKDGLRIRHTGDLKSKVRDAQSALGITVREFKSFAADAEVMGRTPVADVRHYADDVLDAVLDMTAADALKGSDALAAALQVTEAERELAAKSFERKIERRGEVLEDILSRYESERCGLNGQRGTAWAALNAVTESADHGKLGGRFTGTENARASRRFESILTGDADEAKQVAYQSAMALAS